ncbi:hypothetical protein [Micromonospora vulcania]|uniref:Uncharacterized protein n=1 Tax=Micromonospora vulcania TaxID=1441873 RepID=A0ABW1H5J9_9ACTN
MKYRTDGATLIEVMPTSHARASMQFFSEAVRNWEMKEDIADHFGADPFAFGAHMNRVDKMLDDFCESHDVYYMNADIFAPDNVGILLSAMDAALDTTASGRSPRGRYNEAALQNIAHPVP